MDNYTVTFYCRDCINIPQEENVRQDKVCGEVLEKLVQHKLELVDFNLTENYETYPESFKKSAKLSTIVEIKVDLTRNDLTSRESIYNRCLFAMQQKQLRLTKESQAADDRHQYLIFEPNRRSQSA